MISGRRFDNIFSEQRSEIVMTQDENQHECHDGFPDPPMTIMNLLRTRWPLHRAAGVAMARSVGSLLLIILALGTRHFSRVTVENHVSRPQSLRVWTGKADS